MLLVCSALIGAIILLAIERSVILAHIDTVAVEIHARINAECDEIHTRFDQIEEAVKGKL